MRGDVELARPSLIDVLDRVLDKGIIIDGWSSVAVAGIDLINIDAWVVVASIQTYLQYAESLGLSPRLPTSAPSGETPTGEMGSGRMRAGDMPLSAMRLGDR